jgi:hypothetical protein
VFESQSHQIEEEQAPSEVEIPVPKPLPSKLLIELQKLKESNDGKLFPPVFSFAKPITKEPVFKKS